MGNNIYYVIPVHYHTKNYFICNIKQKIMNENEIDNNLKKITYENGDSYMVNIVSKSTIIENCFCTQSYGENHISNFYNKSSINLSFLKILIIICSFLFGYFYKILNK
jgi:hypothetical protein